MIIEARPARPANLPGLLPLTAKASMIEAALPRRRLRCRHLDHALARALAEIDPHLPLLPLRPVGRHVRHMDQGRARHPRLAVTIIAVASADDEREAEAHTDAGADVAAAAPGDA